MCIKKCRIACFLDMIVHKNTLNSPIFSKGVFHFGKPVSVHFSILRVVIRISCSWDKLLLY